LIHSIAGHSILTISSELLDFSSSGAISFFALFFKQIAPDHSFSKRAKEQIAQGCSFVKNNRANRSDPSFCNRARRFWLLFFG